ncbi:MAG: hypothetical protein ABSA52_16010 [Candidatus Binatia bacterium]
MGQTVLSSASPVALVAWSAMVPAAASWGFVLQNELPLVLAGDPTMAWP